MTPSVKSVLDQDPVKRFGVRSCYRIANSSPILGFGKRTVLISIVLLYVIFTAILRVTEPMLQVSILRLLILHVDFFQPRSPPSHWVFSVQHANSSHSWPTTILWSEVQADRPARCDAVLGRQFWTILGKALRLASTFRRAYFFLVVPGSWNSQGEGPPLGKEPFAARRWKVA